MSEEQKSGGWIRLISWLLLTILFYILSCGPFVRIYPSGGAPKAIGYFYTPLDWMREYTPLRPLVNWYMELWAPPNGLRDMEL